MYVGETGDNWERFVTHIDNMLQYLRHGTVSGRHDHDANLTKAVKQCQLYYTHILIPSCAIQIVRLIEQAIIHCVKLAFGENSLVNEKSTLSNELLDKFEFGYDEIIAIGSIFMANFLEEKLFEINEENDDT